MNAALDTRLDALEHAINGNGRPGLKTDVAVLQKEVSELSDIKNRLVRLERAIYGALGALALLELVFKISK